MTAEQFRYLVVLVLISLLALLAGMYLLANFGRLFRRQIKNEWLRKNAVVWMIAICLVFAIQPTNPESYSAILNHNLFHFFVMEFLGVTVEVLFVFNVSWLVLNYLTRKNFPFRQRMVIILLTIIVFTILINIPITYVAYNGKVKNLHFSILFSFYTGCMTGLIYITMNYVDLDRKRKLNEKEIELIRLRELKTKAELDALHSKINPHFLYNALNSIADLSITDGKKGRRMTVALADLFRYSINYSDNNYSTVKEELDMASIYLEIEKIRFEDKLNYSVRTEDDVNHYLLPRFLLQPVVENAVKHGLKATGMMTEILVQVRRQGEGIEISIADNGPAFPAELRPGYGVKSIFDKLDLLFSSAYEVHFINNPEKRVSIQIHKLMKNEPGV